MNCGDWRLLGEDNSRTWTVETRLITEPGEQKVINGNRQKWWITMEYIYQGDLLLQPKSTMVFFFWICKRFFTSPRVCVSTETNFSQSSPRLGVSLWAVQRMWHIKRTEQRTSQHQTFQKNTAQLGNVLLLVIHHSHNTSDGEVGWLCTDAQHYNQCPVWKEEAPRGPNKSVTKCASRGMHLIYGHTISVFVTGTIGTLFSCLSEINFFYLEISNHTHSYIKCGSSARHWFALR